MRRHDPSFFARRRWDLILIASLLALALLVGVLWLCLTARGGTVRVTVDGALVGSYPLECDRTEHVEIPGGGYNVVTIEGGSVRVSDADCPGHDCMRQGRVSRAGRSIICLPHRLLVTVERGRPEVDIPVALRPSGREGEDAS